MNRFIALLTLCVTIASFAVIAADNDQQTQAEPAAPASKQDETAKWMKIKLRSSQEIFAALTRGDAKAVETNAGKMLLLNALEEWRNNSKFTRHSDYDAQMNAFEYATKELIRTSKDNDIDGALDAYVLMTKSCVKCHQIIRDVPAE